MKQLARRVRNILVRPPAEWRAIKVEPLTYSLLLRYVAVLAAIPPLSAVAGRIAFDRAIPDSALSLSLNYLAVTNALWYCMYVLNVMIAGAIIALIMTIAGTGWNNLRGLAVATYSYTPLYLSGLVAVVPHMRWMLYPAILYALYLAFLGIEHLAGFPKPKAAACALFSFAYAGAIIGVLNMFEYVLEFSVVTRVLSSH